MHVYVCVCAYMMYYYIIIYCNYIYISTWEDIFLHMQMLCHLHSYCEMRTGFHLWDLAACQ